MTCTAHWWQLGTPNGPTSLGVCKNCGETREFENGEVMKKWTLPPSDPQRLPAGQYRPAGKSTASKRGALKGINKVASPFTLETEVDRT